MITGSSKTCLITISLAVLIVVWFGCTSTPSEPEFDNPLIPGDPHFEPPMVSLIDAPAEGPAVAPGVILLRFLYFPRCAIAEQTQGITWGLS